MKTHYAAIKDGVVVGTRSSESRHVDGTGRNAAYTHAILRRTRRTMLATGESTETDAIVSWHGGTANAASGLRDARKWSTYTVDYDYRPRETHYTESNLSAEVVDVVIVPRPAKIGAAIEGGR